MAIFLVVDYYRQVDYSVVFKLRFGYLLLSSFIIAFAWKRALRANHINYLMLFTIVALLVFNMTLAYYGKMPSYLLTNLTVMILMAVPTICGLPLRQSILLNTFYLVSFFIFSQRILPIPFYKTQYANISLMFVNSTIAGILLEVRRRRSFLLYEDMAKKKNRIEELNEQKNKIISVLSHDVASPIHSLTALLQLQETGQVTEQEIKPFIKDIRKRLDSVSTLVYGLVRWSKSQLEGFVPEKNIIDLGKLVDEIAELFRPAASDKSVKIEVHIAHSLLVFSDEEMIRIAVRNILSNAVKFSIPNSTIALRAFRENENIKIRVTNSGVPIGEKVIQKLFSYQVSSSEGTAGEKGTGLGLAMASYFVKSNGGKIIFEGYDPSKQTVTFTIELPAKNEGIK
jgi:signal transduction histidine kinase